MLGARGLRGGGGGPPGLEYETKLFLFSSESRGRVSASGEIFMKKAVAGAERPEGGAQKTNLSVQAKIWSFRFCF